MRRFGIFALMLSASLYAADITEQSFSFTIKAANTDSVFQEIIREAESKGGYFTNFSEYYIHLRIPVSALQEFESAVRNFAEIEERSFSGTDKSAELERLSVQIQSRKKLLETYMNMVKNAPFAELQSVEREMVGLNRQIESLQGRKQAIERRVEQASVSIRAYAAVLPMPRVSNTHSPFVWINSTDLNSLRRDF